MLPIYQLSNPKKKKPFHAYYNEHNYFNKSTIKLSQIREKMFKEIQKETSKIKDNSQLPKMLFSNSVILKDNRTFDQSVLKRHSPECHAKKPLFEELLNSIDEFDLNFESNEFENMEDEKKPIQQINNQETKINLAAEITNTTLAQEINENKRNYKESLHFKNYGKFKYTQQGLSFPKGSDEHNLPIYECDSSRELKYYNYRKEINNPKIFYKSIGSFNEKFNKELARISHSYGKDKSKAYFVDNPLLKLYTNIIPIYENYKDVKIVESRYTNNASKFKLLPIINARKRNFDRLGAKIYQNMKLSKISL